MQQINSRGFTLIEILVVVSIIGILAALLLSNMVGVRERAADARLKSNLKQMATALRLYYNDNQTYPPSGTCVSLQGTYLTTTYIPTGVIPATDCAYVRATSGDTFYACALLNSSAGTEDNTSAVQCNATSVNISGSTYNSEGYFCVCNN